MKITNQQIVNFFNTVPGPDGVLSRKIPKKLFNALDLNINALQPAVNTYMKQYNDCKEDASAVIELLNIEVEAVIQTVPEEVFERMDESDKFDSLSGNEYRTLQFMITK